MNDPRKTPGFKQKRSEQQIVELLGAIFDALAKKPDAVEPRQVETRATRAKSDSK